jgi:hypothetical protein
MKIPGFTAASSIYRTDQTYASPQSQFMNALGNVSQAAVRRRWCYICITPTDCFYRYPCPLLTTNYVGEEGIDERYISDNRNRGEIDGYPWI